jgi:hypothetical protein
MMRLPRLCWRVAGEKQTQWLTLKSLIQTAGQRIWSSAMSY